MPFPPQTRFPQTAPNGTSRLPLRGLTLLVVDDSRFACDALRLILQRCGARMRRAESLEIARLHVGCYRPDVAIVDLGLPDGRGEDLIAELSQQGLPVLGLSGDPEGRDRALEAGAAAFLEKPVASVTGFVRLIRQLMVGVGPEASGEDTPAPHPDPAALRDDLRLAVDLVLTKGDPGYALSFLQGLGRASRDPALERAARGAKTPFDRARLARMIEDRLSVLQGLG